MVSETKRRLDVKE